jgi:hypothetical protein
MMASWAVLVSLPQRSFARWKTTWSLRTSTQTGSFALPETATASQPAYFIMAEKRPPKLERVNQEMGTWP